MKARFVLVLMNGDKGIATLRLPPLLAALTSRSRS